MSDLTDTLSDGLLELEADAKSIMVWPSASANPKDQYPCTGSDEKTQLKLDLGGFKIMADVTLVLRMSLFTDKIAATLPSYDDPKILPQKKQTVWYLSTQDAVAAKLRIDERFILWNRIIVLGCNAVSEGA